MAASQYLVPAMPARAARTSYSGPSRLRIPRVVNLRHGYTNARRRRLQTIFSSQPVNPSRNHQPPTVAEAVARDRTFLPRPYPPPLHSTKRLTSGHGETRIPNWRYVQPSSWGRGIQSLNHRACRVHSPLPGAIQHPAWSTPSPKKKKPEIGMKRRKWETRDDERLQSLPQMPAPALQVDVSCPRVVNRDLDPRHQTTWTYERSQLPRLPAGERNTTISPACDERRAVGVDANLPHHRRCRGTEGKALDDRPATGCTGHLRTTTGSFLAAKMDGEREAHAV